MATDRPAQANPSTSVHKIDRLEPEAGFVVSITVGFIG
jgi:hypothetical protein